jgi:hypothetical protein
VNPPSAACPRCGAPRVAGPECPACGVIYLRAEARAAARHAESRDLEAFEAAQREAEDQRQAMREALEAHAVPSYTSPLTEALPEQARPTDLVADAGAEERTEARLRLAVLPVALLLAWLAVRSPGFHFLLRTFLTMPAHEVGHAVTAWFCGFSAVPTLWVTHISDERSAFMTLLVAGLLGALVWQGWQRRRWSWLGVGVALLLVQACCRFGLSLDKARALTTFGGDGGMMVLGALLMATFYVPAHHALRRNALRWGFVAMGAASFMDCFEQWWAARTNVDRIPFGLIEGVGMSDPTKLVELHDWNVATVIRAYVNLGWVCLAALGVLYLVALWRARGDLRG